MDWLAVIEGLQAEARKAYAEVKIYTSNDRNMDDDFHVGLSKKLHGDVLTSLAHALLEGFRSAQGKR